MPAVLVFIEAREGSLNRHAGEALTVARGLALGDTAAVVCGTGLSEQAQQLGQQFGATAVMHADHATFNAYSGEGYARAIIKQAAAVGAELRAVLIVATAMGKDLAPRVAAGLGAAFAADCTELTVEDGALTATRPVYAGKARMVVKPSGDGPIVATLRPGAFTAEPIDGGAAPALETIDVGESTDLRDVVKEIVRSAQGKLDVAEADIVVAGGRGLGTPEEFERLIPPVANALGAAIGASRAVVDAGWRPHAEQVGQTGKTVAPQLYIACGIRGAVQHLAGMASSKCIVAINKDADAPIFKVADYGIVGTVEDCLPVLADELKRVRG